MGKLIAVENKTEQLIFVGDQIVSPGDCRHFDEDLVPHHLRPAVAAADLVDEIPPRAADAIAAAFGCESAELLAKISEITDTVPDNDVGTLHAARERCAELLETEGKAEKSRPDVITALAKLQLVIGEKLVAAEANAKAAQEAADAAAAQEAEAKAKAEAERVAAAEAWAHKVRGLNRTELIAHLKAKHVKFESDANKDRLVELCIAHP